MDAYSKNKHYIHWHCSQPHRCHYRHYQWCPEFHKELPVCSTTTGQDQLGLVLDFPKTQGPCYYHKQDWFFQFLYTHRIIWILLVLFWQSQIWFSRNCVCLFLERATTEGDLFFFRRRLLTGFFGVVHPVTPLSPLALFGVLARSLQLAVNENESWLRLSFHENRLSSSFSSRYRTSTIDFGITLGSPSIINFQKITVAWNLRPHDLPSFLSFNKVKTAYSHWQSQMNLE